MLLTHLHTHTQTRYYMLPLPFEKRPQICPDLAEIQAAPTHLGSRPSGAGKPAEHKEPFVEHKQSLRENFPVGRGRLAPLPEAQMGHCPSKMLPGRGKGWSSEGLSDTEWLAMPMDSGL